MQAKPGTQERWPLLDAKRAMEQIVASMEGKYEWPDWEMSETETRLLDECETLAMEAFDLY